MEKKLDVRLLVVGIVVHSIIFYSIFDVYFKSPLIHGIEPIARLNPNPPAADRLVLFVADGLRADSFLNLVDKDPTLYMSKKKETNGGHFAISNTQVPTESRPGHVAMIAGFYEDISAVAKGWKENPVEFDSFFNKSKYTWSWGSPDILTMFKKSSQNVFTKTYDSSIEDFASANASVLDTWVLHHFKKFLYHSQVNKTETEMLQEKGVVFFLHLLGIDTNGHSKKPHSNEYISNIIVVDRLVEEVTNLVEEYYKHDNRTAFIFTADHGMTDWGSHGSGDDSERLTPFVAWGAGIKTSKYDRENLLNIRQVDIAPLMSHLIGVPIPINSIGKIPLDLLDTDDRAKCLAFKQNALQIIEQLKKKHDECKNTAIFFKEYSGLKMSALYETLEAIDQMIDKHRYDLAIKQLDELIDLSLQAFDYYQKYNKLYLGTCIVLSCVGWIVYLLIKIFYSNNDINRGSDYFSNKYNQHINVLFWLIGIVTIFLAFYQSFPVTFYIYTILPILLWRKIIMKLDFWIYLYSLWNSDILRNSMYFVAMIIGLELMVLSFFYRWVFSILLVFYAVQLFLKFNLKSDNKNFKLGLITCSLILAVFPLLPVIHGYNHLFLVYASSFILNVMFVGINIKLQNGKPSKSSLIMMVINFFSLINIISIRVSVGLNHGLPRLGQFYSCFVILSCCLVPVSVEASLKKRLTLILVTLINLYLHLSISYESVFIIFLTLQMIFWLLLETYAFSGSFDIEMAFNKKRTFTKTRSLLDDENDNMNWSNVFRVYLLIFYLLLSFFGTGNMASINSFDPVSVYCFITVFSPFLMGFLLVLKIIIPFLIVVVVFYCIYEVIDLSVRTSFTFLMIMSDIMALNFFFLIRTEGSWLDIGTSISHYIIVMIIIIFVSLLFLIAQYLFKFELMRFGILRKIKNGLLKFD